jgi:hypothetical protein
MTTGIFVKASIYWLLLGTITLFIGVLRIFFLAPDFGALGEIVTFALFVFAALRLSKSFAEAIDPEPDHRSLWYAGLYWVCLTITADFVLGHFLLGGSWEEILFSYDIREGRLWPFFLLIQLAGPILFTPAPELPVPIPFEKPGSLRERIKRGA